jgi:hypothetical protein
MFGHHDDNPQADESLAMPQQLDDGGTSSDLPMTENEDAMMPVELGSPAATTTASAPQTFRQSTSSDDRASLSTPAPSTDQGAPDDLISIKQEALQNLKPLIGHLEQTPEEKFRTTMMMIQAAGDQSLIPDAYAAAKKISDDKVRAQALLDVVNEINYFTQHTQA